MDAEDVLFRPKPPPPCPLFPYFGLAPNADLLVLLLAGGLEEELLEVAVLPKFLVSMFVFFPAFLSNVTCPLVPRRELTGTLSKPPMVYVGPSSFLLDVVDFVSFFESSPNPSSEYANLFDFGGNATCPLESLGLAPPDGGLLLVLLGTSSLGA